MKVAWPLGKLDRDHRVQPTDSSCPASSFSAATTTTTKQTNHNNNNNNKTIDRLQQTPNSQSSARSHSVRRPPLQALVVALRKLVVGGGRGRTRGSFDEALALMLTLLLDLRLLLLLVSGVCC
mmetsp:Transcript_14162/g.30747  ORF Transcript_14162/g.30747 Transcript_14162/m.30747 type:complete len:123 (-) Transcript_14162:400-768(-)